MPLLLLLILIGLMHAARSFSPQPGLNTGAAGVTLAAGFLLLTALFAGNLFKEMRLPKLTGYLALGILAGPQILNLVTEPMLDRLRIFNGVATALIALTAGTEMDIRLFRPLFRGIFWITGTAVLGTVVLLSVSAFFLRDLLPFTAGFDQWQMVAIAAVLGVTMASQSPAVVVALRKEMEADGPVSRTVLGIVVVSDLLIIVLFAIVSGIARGVLGSSGGGVSGGTLAWEVFGSVAVGAMIGILIAAFLRLTRAGGSLFVVTAGFLVAEVGQRIDLDPLLVALAAGMWIRNLTRHADRLHGAIEEASLPVYMAFFAVAGATIHLDALATVALPAVTFILIRAAGFLTGNALGARLAGSDPAIGRWAGFGLLPQAGLALALASLFSRTFPQLGPEAAALVFGIVGLNELLTPVLYRWALVRAGEAGQVPGTTSQHVALADAGPDAVR